MKHLRTVVAIPCAALNALAYTTGFALGRAVEAHYRRNLARVVPQPDRETARLRAAMRADVLIATGLADLDFDAWQAERERDVAAGESA